MRKPTLDTMAAYYAEAARAHRTWPVVVAVYSLVLAAIGGAFFHDEIGLALESSPGPYDPQRDEASFRTWMGEDFPNYVIAASRSVDERQEGARVLVERSAFHRGLQRRARAITRAVEGWHTFISVSPASRRERLLEELGDVTRELDRLEDMLRGMGAPFTVDHDIGLVKVEGTWQLRFVASTLEVRGVTRFTDGQSEVATARVARLDRLNVIDLLHGKARRGYAYVFEENARREVLHRYLPALKMGGTLRSLGEAPRTHDVLAAFARPELVALLPEDLRPHADELGTRADDRRTALRQLDALLALNGSKLIEPTTLFLSEGWLQEMHDAIGGDGFPELMQNLRRFTTRTDLSDEERSRLVRAEEALLDAFLLGVERHEAWHLLVPTVPEGQGLPQSVRQELIAYTGALADADKELVLVDDQLHHLFRSFRNDSGVTSTSMAVKMLVMTLLVMRDDDPAEDAHPSRGRQRVARAKLEEWFGEKRSLRVVSRTRGAGALLP